MSAENFDKMKKMLADRDLQDLAHIFATVDRMTEAQRKPPAADPELLAIFFRIQRETAETPLAILMVKAHG